MQFQSVRLLCAAAAAPPRSLSVTGPTLELASKRPKQQSRAARTNQPPSHKYRWALGAGTTAHLWLQERAGAAESRMWLLRVRERTIPRTPRPIQFGWQYEGARRRGRIRGEGKATKRARRRRSRRADYTAANRTVVNGSWGTEETHCGGAAPKADGPGYPAARFVANADSIRQNRRTVYRGTTWLKVCSAESSQYTEKITDRARRDQQRLTLRESRVRWVLWGAAQY